VHSDVSAAACKRSATPPWKQMNTFIERMRARPQAFHHNMTATLLLIKR
jgi:hypothetical protein